MPITYRDDIKALPNPDLLRLFRQAGWSDGNEGDLAAHFNAPFAHSTLVVSAWDGERLIGCVRVLSDTIIRSVVYDLVVEESYRCQGIGGQLLRRCFDHYPYSEWLLQTEEHIVPFYEKQGLLRFADPVMHKPSIYQE